MNQWKKRLAAGLCVMQVSLAIGAAAPLGVSAANSGNLIANPGMTRLETDGKPTKWSGTIGWNGKNSIVSDHAESGRGTAEAPNNVMKTISGTGGDLKPVFYDKNPKTPLKAGETYKIKMYLRMKNATAGFGVQVAGTRVAYFNHLDPEANLSADPPPSGKELRVPEDTWLENAAFFRQASDVADPSLSIKNANPGDAVMYFDNVGLFRVDLNDPVFNQSFEVGETDADALVSYTGWDVPVEAFDHWGWTQVPDAFALDSSGDNAHTGDSAVKITGGAPETFSQRIAVNPNTDYYLEYYTKGDGGPTISVENDDATLVRSASPASEGWVKTLEKVNTGDVTRLKVKVSSTMAAGTTYLDDVRLTVADNMDVYLALDTVPEITAVKNYTFNGIAMMYDTISAKLEANGKTTNYVVNPDPKTGKFSVPVELVENLDGSAVENRFIVTATQQGKDPVTASVSIQYSSKPQPGTKEYIIEKLDDAAVSDSDKMAMLKENQDFIAEQFGVDFSKYNAVTDDAYEAYVLSAVSSQDYNYREGETAFKKFADDMNDAILLGAINYGGTDMLTDFLVKKESGQQSDAAAKGMNEDILEDYYQLLNSNTNTAKQALTDFYASIAKGRLYSGFEVLISAAEQQIGLQMINLSSSGTIHKQLTKYTDILGIAGHSYFSLSKTDAADKAIVSSKYASAEALIAGLDSAVKAQEDSEKSNDKNNTNAGGNRGGSSGSSRGNITNTVKVDQPPKEVPPDYEPPTEEKTMIFTDLAGYDWASDSIKTLYSKGVIAGFSDGTYRPGDAVTREQLVKLIVEALELADTSATNNFADCNTGDWFYAYVSAAVKHGIVTGISETEFGAGQAVSRADAAVMLNRAAVVKGIALDGAAQQIFVDADKIPTYAVEAVRLLQGAGILSGMEDGTFAPNAKLTRAETAKLLCGLLNK